MSDWQSLKKIARKLGADAMGRVFCKLWWSGTWLKLKTHGQPTWWKNSSLSSSIKCSHWPQARWSACPFPVTFKMAIKLSNLKWISEWMNKQALGAGNSKGVKLLSLPSWSPQSPIKHKARHRHKNQYYKSQRKIKSQRRKEWRDSNKREI